MLNQKIQIGVQTVPHLAENGSETGKGQFKLRRGQEILFGCLSPAPKTFCDFEFAGKIIIIFKTWQIWAEKIIEEQEARLGIFDWLDITCNTLPDVDQQPGNINQISGKQ